MNMLLVIHNMSIVLVLSQLKARSTLSVDAVHGSHITRKINQSFPFSHALEEVQQLILAYSVMRILVEVPT